MMTASTKTVRDYALEIPGAVELFEELGIDYCCGGGVPLDHACETAGIPFEPVTERLAALKTDHPAPSVNWHETSLAGLIAHIVETHHVYTRAALRRIPGLLEKTVAAHGGHHPELVEVQRLFRLVAADLDLHLQKEEAILFPYIVELERAVAEATAVPHGCFPSVDYPIRAMEAEHDLAGELLRKIRHASGDFIPPADACPTFIETYRALLALETDLHRHIHLENNVLHPRALALETESGKRPATHSVS